ncbi:MAG: response regulator transcription factor [Saccharofermentanales bacterium]
MFNVLLVEDEINVLENLKNSPIWETGEFSLVASAANGEDGLEILKREQIDIVVTDITMPVMDGLELSSQIRQTMPNIKIIILSGFGDFQYARKALSLGVSEYLLKPVRFQDLHAALRKVAAKLRDEIQVNREIASFRQQVQNNMQYQRNIFLENLSFGIIPMESMNGQAKMLELNLDFKTVSCAIVSFFENKILINESEHLMILEIQKMIEDALQTQDIITFNRNQREYNIIFRNPRMSDIKNILQKIREDIARQRHLSQNPYRPRIAVGGVKKSIAGIAESCADARFLLNFQHLVTNKDLLFMDEVQPFLQSTYQSELGVSSEMELVTRTLNTGTQKDIPLVVENLVKWLQLINYNLVFFQNICIKITNIINNFLVMIDEDPGEILFDQNGGIGNLLSNNWQNWFSDIPAFKNYLVSTLTSIIDIRDKKNRYKYNDVILKAKKYIDEHYNDSNISLTGIASFANVNPSYFSTLFSQEMGKSFIEYLTDIRIEKAKVLLKTTSMRTLDIAFAVGFSDSNYFSKIFKRITNESPRSFKSKTDESTK